MCAIVAHLVLKSLDTTDTNTVNHADTILVFILQIDTGILYTLNGRDKGQLGVAVEFAGLLAVNPLIDIEILDLAGKLCFKLGCVELCNGCGTALTGQHGFPCLLCAIAQRRHGA